MIISIKAFNENDKSVEELENFITEPLWPLSKKSRFTHEMNLATATVAHANHVNHVFVIALG